MEAIAFLRGSQQVAFDGIHFKEEDNGAKYGYSLVDRPANILQIIIDGKAYAVHAAMKEYGFIAWEIFEGNVCGTDVATFIKMRVTPMFSSDDYLLLDNAKNHKTAEVFEALENDLGGRYKFNAEYSPELNPIELGFSMVRAWIRANQHRYSGDPIGLINAGFHHYSMYDPEHTEGYKCYNLFEMYRVNHQQVFLNNGV